MDPYRAFYEYPSSHGAIQALPARNMDSLTPAKAKRTWGNILRIPGRSKKDKDSTPGGYYNQLANIYSPGFRLPQGQSYVSPSYTPQKAQFITSVPYRDPGRNHLLEYREKHGKYNATCGRSSANPVLSPPINNGPSRGTVKNTIKYTDWFGSVVGRKPPLRPSLPNFHSGSELSNEQVLLSPSIPSSVPSWDNYVSIKSPPIAVEIPAYIPIQNYGNICMCPDQLYSTRSKKKKKCKQCGQKYGTIKHATAISSVSRIRPAITPNLYQVPNPAWAWPQANKSLYTHHYLSPQRPQATNILKEDDEDHDSSPRTPETLRSGKSGRSGRSNESSVTLTQENNSQKKIPPPPTVPLPSIPKYMKDQKEDDKRSSLLEPRQTAYDLMEKENDLQLSSDTDDLSDNAVNDSWEKLEEMSVNKTNKRDVQRTSKDMKDQNRVSVISIGGKDDKVRPTSICRETRDLVKVVSSTTPSFMDSNKVRIYTDSSAKVIIQNRAESPRMASKDYPVKISNGIVKINTINISNSQETVDKDYNENLKSKSVNGYSQHDWDSRNYNSNPSQNIRKNSPIRSIDSNRRYNYTNVNSSQLNNKNKYNNAVRETFNSHFESGPPVRDNSKVVSIAGQRILFDQSQAKKSPSKPKQHKYNQNGNNNFCEEEPLFNSIPEIGDWEPLQETTKIEDVYNKHEKKKFSITNSIEPVNEEQDDDISDKVEWISPPKDNLSMKTIEHKWSILSPDVRDTIHEEEEEVDEEKKYHDNKSERNSKLNDADYSNEDNQESKVLKINGYLDADEGDKGTSSSSTGSPVRNSAFQPTLSELLQVKSILKRPNSLDTSSETDSDFYLPTFSEFKQNLRKKKSVQFRQSDEVTVLETANESKGRKVSSLKNGKKDRERKKEKSTRSDVLFGDLKDIYAGTEEANETDKLQYKSEFSDKYNSNWNFMNGSNSTNDEQNTSSDNTITMSEDAIVFGQDIAQPKEVAPEDQSGNTNSEGSVNLHRSLSQRQTVDVSVPAFNDTYRQGQPNIRPSVPLLGDVTPSGNRRPTRRAPPPPRSSMSPLRPTVPPPPPPPPAPPIAPPSSTNSQSTTSPSPLPTNSLFSLSSVHSDLENNFTIESKDEESISVDNETLSPPSSISLSPPPSPTLQPPPLPSSSPPPLPTSSPPPLDDQDDLSSPGLTFSSFRDPISNVSISARTQQIQPFQNDLTNSQIREMLPSPNIGSIFSNNSNEEFQTATIRNRAKASRPFMSPDLTTYLPITNSQNTPPNQNDLRRNKSRNRSPNQKSSFLSSMVEENDTEERYSDHIYEELPSIPSSPSGNNVNFPEKSIFDGASKYEILEFLQDARNRVNIAADDVEEDMQLINPLTQRLDNMILEDEEDQAGLERENSMLPTRYMDGRSSNRSSNSESSENSGLLRSDKERLTAGEIERTDSGVGSETSKPKVVNRRHSRSIASSSTASGSHAGLREGDLPPCDDCDSPVEARVTNSGLMYAPLVCRRCSRRRQERKEILTEIMETEVKYGRDLKVMMDQFCRPMRVAGLLSQEQLGRIFLNIEDLIEHNRQFSLQLRDAYEIALDQGDEDLLTVNVAKLFLQASPMLHAFQNYCVRQGAASILLQNLEKERELLRIFLKVSQMENTLLRRMNLHSFLMVPVQRVTKYPLLLTRLYKTTPPSHPSREDCRRAREKIELYLQHINNETKEVSPTKLWRRISMSVGNNNLTPKSISQPPDYDTSLKLRAVALEVLEWSADEAFIVREGRLLCLPPESSNWTRRGRGIKMATVQMVLVTRGRPRLTLEEAIPEEGLVTPRDLGIKEAAILAFKDHRLTKTALIREPWLLSGVVATWDAEGETECFEITDLATKDTFIFKDRECVGTEEWFRSVQFHALSVGSWRRRRPALANIMINGTRRS